MPPNVAISDTGSATRRDHRRPQLAQEQEDHHHDQRHGQHQRELHVGDGGADRRGAVGHHGDLQCRRQAGREFRQQRAHRFDHLDGVGAGLALDVQDHRRRAVVPCRQFGILHAVDRAADVAQQHRRAVAIGDHRRLIGVGGQQLIVGADLERLVRAVELTLRIVHGAGGHARGARPRATGRGPASLADVGLQPDGPRLAAFHRHRADAARSATASARSWSRRSR